MDTFQEVAGAKGAFKFYIDGQWKESESGDTVSVLNPQTNEEAFKVQSCTQVRAHVPAFARHASPQCGSTASACFACVRACAIKRPIRA